MCRCCLDFELYLLLFDVGRLNLRGHGWLFWIRMQSKLPKTYWQFIGKLSYGILQCWNEFSLAAYVRRIPANCSQDITTIGTDWQAHFVLSVWLSLRNFIFKSTYEALPLSRPCFIRIQFRQVVMACCLCVNKHCVLLWGWDWSNSLQYRRQVPIDAFRL